MVLAARTNSCSLRLNTCPRTTLAISTQYTVPRAMMILWIPWPRRTIIRMTYSVSGIVLIISTIRIITVSTIPPAYPDIPPKSIPITILTAAATKATIRDTLVPYISRVRISRPRLSVPST